MVANYNITSNYSTKTRQAGCANELSMYSPMSMAANK
jgi:hypothetical protein